MAPPAAMLMSSRQNWQHVDGSRQTGRTPSNPALRQNTTPASLTATMRSDESHSMATVHPSPDLICAQSLDLPGGFVLPSAGRLRDEDAAKHSKACSSPDQRLAVGFTPTAVLVTSVAMAIIALAILLPPVSEASFNAVAAAAALSPVAVSLLSGPATRLASDANLAALLLLDCVLAAVASATLLPLLPGATVAASAFAKDLMRRLLDSSALASLGGLDAWALAPVCAAGFAAQLVDGSLGMGYGLTSATVLTAAGLSPTTASSSVHLAQLGTTLVSGLAHHRHGNVDLPAMARLSPAGAVGALTGALLLSSVPVGAAKLVSGSLLFLLGVGVLLRFLLAPPPDCDEACTPEPEHPTDPPSQAGQLISPATAGKPGRAGAHLAPLGFLGGFVDATGGGGWGPVATSTLLADGKLCPARVVGEPLPFVASLAWTLISLPVRAGSLTPCLFSQHRSLRSGGWGCPQVDLSLLLLPRVSNCTAAPSPHPSPRPTHLTVFAVHKPAH
jgi:hypothetical protein